MEDLSRNLSRGSQVRNPGSSHKVPRRWTVLFVDDFGKTVSFHVGKPLLVALTACLSVMLAVVTYSVVSYNSARLKNVQLRKDLDTLKADLERAEGAREKALVGLMMLDEGSVKQTVTKAGSVTDSKTKDVALKKTKPRQAAKAKENAKAEAKAKERAKAEAKVKERAKAEAKAPEKPMQAVKASQPVQVKKDKTTPPVTTARLLVKDLEIWREPGANTFKFQFSLKNVDQEGNRIAGHTFVVLKPEEGSREPIRAFPWSPLKDGKPAIFKRGQFFSIAHFKFVRGKLTDVIAIDRFKTANVYVFSDTGGLLVEKNFEVDKILRKGSSKNSTPSQEDRTLPNA